MFSPDIGGYVLALGIMLSVLLAAFLYGRDLERKERAKALAAYAAYEQQMCDEWKKQGYAAWLELWEAQEQEQER